MTPSATLYRLLPRRVLARRLLAAEAELRELRDALVTHELQHPPWRDVERAIEEALR